MAAANAMVEGLLKTGDHIVASIQVGMFEQNGSVY